MERCSPDGESDTQHRVPRADGTETLPAPVSAAAVGTGEVEEGVFEIRDFTAASSFERLTHQISLAIKRWAETLRKRNCVGAGMVPGDDGGQRILLEGFDHADFRYELQFQFVKAESSGASSSAPSSVDAPERLGLHTFPTRVNRLQRWFGVQHFVVLGVRDQSVDLDSARTLLSALVLATRSAVLAPGLPPLACFVTVDGGRRRRFLGELTCGGFRTIYTTDLTNTVEPNLEHLTGLLEFFWLKLAADPQDPGQSLSIGARFTYFADAFEPLVSSRGGTGWIRGRLEEEQEDEKEEEKDEEEDGTRVAAEQDPVESVQLHCLWPSFPRGAFVDNDVYSELDPRTAPYWKLRVLRRDTAVPPLTQRLKNLLDFRKEARTVQSAEHSVLPQMPKTALASLSYAIQESLESILLPTTGEMMDLTAECLGYPIVQPLRPLPSSPSASLVPRGHCNSHRRTPCGTQPTLVSAQIQPLALASLRGAASRSRLQRIAEIGADMKCFKGAVMLWCQVITQMRRQWDELEAPAEGALSPETRRVPASGVRTEHFDMASLCLIQQKFEMLQRSIEARLNRTAPVAAPPCSEKPVLSPVLVPPALMTEDMVLQCDLAASGMSDPADRAELFGGRELRSDVAAFKAAKPQATFSDFLEWREKEEALNSDIFPPGWVEHCWHEATARPASEQAQLFEPEKEAEMALHYLENIDGSHLLLQLFRVVLRSTLEELGEMVTSTESGNKDIAHLRMLYDRAQAAALAAFSPPADAGNDSEDAPRASANMDAAAAVLGEVAEFPCEERLQAAIVAIETLESVERLAASLRAKLPGQGEELLDELLAKGEASITSHELRHTVEEVLDRGRALSRVRTRGLGDSHRVLDSIPLCKEFVLLLQPAAAAQQGAAVSGSAFAAKRMYAEIRERHLRLAIARGFRLV